MADHTKSSTERKALSGDRDRLEVGIREQVRTWIEVIVEEELAAVLGAESSVRVGTRGGATGTGRGRGP